MIPAAATGRAVVLRGDARMLPLPDASVDLIVTSPPYYALRAYTDGGRVYDGQIGSEPTPAEYIANLLTATREWVRVLKPSGSIWVNLGDKYDSGTSTSRVNPGTVKDGTGQGWYQGTPRWTGGNAKSLLGLPWRYALACVDQLGLILRAEVIWSKPNGLPESVTDRVRRSHEHWFHLTRQPRYYSAVDEIREPHARSWGGSPNGGHTYGAMKAPGEKDANLPTALPNPLGKLPGSVWEIPTEPLRVPAHLGVDHFAAFPTEWPRRLILGWSPPGICVQCGEGRRPATGATCVTGYVCACTPYTDHPARGTTRRRRYSPGLRHNPQGTYGRHQAGEYERVGPWREYHLDRWTPPPTRPAVVLDPFGGTGTTALVASVLGRIGITVDRSADYCRLAQWRTTDPDERARALRAPKPPRPLDGQPPLFGDWAYDRDDGGPQPGDADVDGYPLGRAARGGA